MKTYFFNRLPHYTPLSASYFITFRLFDSLPQEVFAPIKEQYDLGLLSIQSQKIDKETKALLIRQLKSDYYKNFELQLDQPYGNCFLKDPEIATIVIDTLNKYNGHFYDMYAYVIMPNHVHLLIDTAIQTGYVHDPLECDMIKDYKTLPDIMKLIKGGSAFLCNRFLKRKGPFWAQAYYDTYIRDEDHWYNTINYIINNPINAGLCSPEESYSFLWIKHLEEGF